jgi:tetratricopeptide (TPR) repeat protein
VLLSVTLAVGAACIYFNTYYNADKLFNEGRRDIEEGRESSGLSALAASIEKAEKVVIDNPDSRWADDAWRLIVRARLLREEWEEALEAGRNLERYAATGPDSAEVAGYLGMAQLHLGDPAAADTLLSRALTAEQDDAKRAELLHSRGLARSRLGHLEAADADLLLVTGMRPDWVEPRIDRLSLLVDAGRTAEAADELASILRLGLTEAEERAMLATVRDVAETSPETILAGLAAVESSSLKRENLALLLNLRAELRAARAEFEPARLDYELASRTAPGSRAGVDAGLTAARLRASGAADLREIQAAREELERISQQPAGRRADVMRLRDNLYRVEFWVRLEGLGYVAAAELARDELQAPALARSLFLRYAESEPESIWAPKAILAALELGGLNSGPPPDSAHAATSEADWRRRLREDYRDSPYVVAVLGERPSDGFTYEELEQQLRSQLDRLETLAASDLRVRRSEEAR